MWIGPLCSVCAAIAAIAVGALAGTRQERLTGSRQAICVFDPIAARRKKPTSGAFWGDNRRGMRRRSLLRAAGAPLLAAIGFAAVALTAAEASAGPKVATPCADDPLHCEKAPIGFSYIDSLPVEWAFDTGWVPQNSPLQVHIWAGIYANTRASLSGSYITSWNAEEPGILGLATPGNPMGGVLSFHYGAELGAQGAVHVSILGQQFDWVGDLPYIPQFDFQLEAEDKFDAWAFPPGSS